MQVVLLARRHGSDCGRAHRQARRRAFDSCRWRRLPCSTCQARTPRSCWPGSTPSSARSRRRCADPSPSSPERGPARRGRSRTGSRTAWRPGSTGRPRCWPSPSPPARRASCAAGSSSSGRTACRPGRSTRRPCASCSTSGPARTAATSRRSSTTGCRWSRSRPAGCGSGSTPPGCATWSPRSPGPRSATSGPRTTRAWPSSTTAASPRSTPETVARIFTGYEEAKRDRGRIDFEDILLCTAALISDHPDVAEQVRRTYRHLVVDEYQDVSPLQEALLTLWRGDSQEICVVGDPAQTIHSFAGRAADLPHRVRAPVPRGDRRQARPRLPLDPAGRRLRQPGDGGGGRLVAEARGPAPRRTAGELRRGLRRGGRGVGRRRLGRGAARGRRRLPRHRRALPHQRAVAPARAGAGRPPHPVPGAQRRALLRAARGAPDAGDAAHPGAGARRCGRGRGRVRARPRQGAARHAGLDRASAGGRGVGPGAVGVARRAAQRGRGPRRRAPGHGRPARRWPRCRASSTAGPRRSTCRSPRA